MGETKKKGFWRHAFAVEDPRAFAASEKEAAAIDAVAQRIIRHGLALPGILALESARPMNFLGAQAMAFFEPIVRTIFTQWEGYTMFYRAMERRGSVEYLIDRIEHFENQRQETIAQAKADRKKSRRTKKMDAKARTTKEDNS